jgi:HD-like signal output (HDOD) protein
MTKDELFKQLSQSPHLPIIPEHVSDLFKLLNQPEETDIDLLVQMVSECEPLNDIMLSSLNAGYFSVSQKITTLKEAIVYLGLHAVENLLIFFITRLVFMPSIGKKTRKFDIEKYWKHVLGTAVASSILYDKTKLGNKHTLFSYGLIHDIGIAVLDVCMPHLLDEIFVKLNTGIHQLVAERIVLGGMTHSDIGAWLCQKWGIREDITMVVANHHTPFMATSYREEVALMYVADTISTEYYEKLLSLELQHPISSQVLSSIGLTQEDLPFIKHSFYTQITKISQQLSSIKN